jgi:hypothetical protein
VDRHSTIKKVHIIRLTFNSLTKGLCVNSKLRRAKVEQKSSGARARRKKRTKRIKTLRMRHVEKGRRACAGLIMAD